MAELWVQDRLHDLVGMSSSSVARYFVDLAKQSSSTSELASRLRSSGTVDVDDKMVRFCAELHSRFGKRQAALPHPIAIKADDDDDSDPGDDAKDDAARKRQFRQRVAEVDDADDDDTLALISAAKRRKKEKMSDEEDEDERQERERAEDIEERDAFADRMKGKDSERTRKIAEKSSAKAFDEAARRLKLADSTEERQLLVPKLREESRREYLVKRKDDKIIELESDIKDEEFLYPDVKLSEREAAELKYKRQVLDLARQHEAARKLENVRRYHIPDAKPGAAPEEDEYVELDRKEAGPNSEQRKWEEEHQKRAMMKFGARDKTRSSRSKDDPYDEGRYDLVLDDEIEFVQVRNAVRHECAS